MAAIAALNAALLVAIGACVGGELQWFAAVPCTLLACIVGWSAATGRPLLASMSTTYGLLAAVAAIGMTTPAVAPAVWYRAWHLLHPAAGVLAVGVAAGGTARQRRAAAWALAASATLLYFATPTALPDPAIDVWSWTQTAGQALLKGIHPYTVVAPDPYHGAYDYGSTPTHFPYMPAVLLLAAPAIALVGDYRYVLALSFPVTVLLLRRAAAALKADDEIADAATLALALFPRGAQIVALGYNDMLLLPVAAAGLYGAASERRLGEAIAFLLLPAIKQYVAAPAALYAVMRRRRWTTAVAALAAFGTAAPFLLWNVGATLSGVLFLARGPIGFRDDSVSLTALAAQATGMATPRWLGISAQFVAAAVAYPLVRRHGIGGLFLASALSLLVCFLLATQAFFNYYLFVTALLTLAAVALTDGRPACR